MLFFSISNKFIKKLSKKKRVSQKLFLVDDILRHPLFHAGKGIFMSREPFETMPDVMDAKQLAQALQISKSGAYNLLNTPDFPTLRIGGRKLVMKNELVEWLKSRTNRKA